MNQTAAAVGNTSSAVLADATSTFTTLHLVLIALLALVVIAGIVYGARLKHRRVAAEEAVEAHAQRAGIVPAEPADPVAPEPSVEPTPAPLLDTPALTTAPEALADEPIAAGAPMIASPASRAAPLASGSGAADGSVTQLKGLGPKVAARLAELGFTTVGQIAALDENGAVALDAQLGTFRGRMERDRWIEQARFLAAGDRAGFEAVFGRL